jgi:hypothetical protein
VFVCSFCEAKEAAHWLHYGRAGTGVAIGFDAISLYRVGQFILYEVRYRQDDQRELLRAIVDLVDGYAGQFLAEPEALNLFAEATAMFVQLVAPWMKSPAFESEKEWRLISLQRIVAPETVPFVKLMLPGLPEPDPTRFRTANNRVIPYVTIPLPPSGLTHIELGAASPMSENEQSLRILAQECLRYPINITRSTVSVRP